jgi:hypothetical protein
MWWKASQERVNRAYQVIDELARDTLDPQFPNISRANLVKQMRERVDKPWTLDQNQASLCGPAAFFYCLLNCQPDWFCKYVSDLYRLGNGRVHDLKVIPSEGCRNYKPDPRDIGDVDWIALASLRDSENSVFDYSKPSDTASGITLPGGLASWFRDGGFSGVANDTNFHFSKGLPTLMGAAEKLMLGSYVCLFVNMQIIKSSEYTESSFIPNHWIVLEGPPTKTDDDDIRFSVYSGGEIHSLPPGGGKMSRGDLSGNFYGYVSGMPDYGRTPSGA